MRPFPNLNQTAPLRLRHPVLERSHDVLPATGRIKQIVAVASQEFRGACLDIATLPAQRFRDHGCGAFTGGRPKPVGGEKLRQEGFDFEGGG